MDVVSSWAEIGARIAEARLATAMSQGQVAAELGVDRTAVVRLESGDRHVGALELMRLAQLFGVPVAHFLTRPPATVVSRRTELTSDSDQSARVRYRVDAALEAHARDACWLVEHAGLPRLDPSLSDRMRQYAADPVSLAHEARDVIGMPTGPLGPLADITERFGLYLTVVDIDAEGASLIDGEFGVCVIGGLPQPGRRRWTAAHELGHHLFQDAYHSDAGVAASRDEREQRIDRFVGEFLVPGSDLRQRWEQRPSTASDRDVLIRLAGEFRLSWSAVINRCVNAEFVSPQESRRLKANPPVRGDFISALGTEPQADLEIGTVGVEWRRAVFRAWKRSLITGPRTVELLHGRLGLDELPARDGADLA